MANYISAVFFVSLLAGGFYAALVMGLGDAVKDSFISPRNSLAEASVTPDSHLTPTAIATVTSSPLPATNTPEPPTATPEPPPAAPNRASCSEIIGTQYLSMEERSWYLSNCVAVPNRADCDAIRGTQYLSTAERNWYLLNCV